MKPFLRTQLARYAERLSELDFLLSREDIMQDMEKFLALSREHNEVTQIAGRWLRYQQVESHLAEARDMLADPEMAELAQEEIGSSEAELLQLEDELQRLLLPKKTPMRLAPPMWKFARARAATNRPCLRATWHACTPAMPNRKVGA